MRSVPLKMLPFDNKNELLLLLDFEEGTTLERSDAAVREVEAYLAGVPEVSDYISYVGRRFPDGLQRAGAALLPAAGGPSRRGADQSGREEEPPDAEPRDRAADAQRAAGHRRPAPGADEAGRDAAWTARHRQRGGRSLRSARPPLRGPAVRCRRGADTTGGRARRGRRRRCP